MISQSHFDIFDIIDDVPFDIIDISCRVKIVETMLHDVERYIIYPHTGKKTKKEHFHICIPINLMTMLLTLVKGIVNEPKPLTEEEMAVSCVKHINQNGCECFVS